MLLGLATGLFETTALGLLSNVFPGRQTSHAFAIQKVVYHGIKAASFGYAGYLDLYWQLGILVLLQKTLESLNLKVFPISKTVSGLVGTAAFVRVDMDCRAGRKRRRKVEEDLMSEMTTDVTSAAAAAPGDEKEQQLSV